MNILKSLLIILAMMALVASATSAIFTDQKSIAGNTFSTGTLTLQVERGELKPWNVTNMVPGQETPWETVTVTNTGSLDGILKVSGEFKSGEDNLFNQLRTEIRQGDSSGAILFHGTLPESTPWFTYPLGAGQTLTIAEKVYLPWGSGNDVQGKSTTFDEVFYIEQIGG